MTNVLKSGEHVSQLQTGDMLPSLHMLPETVSSMEHVVGCSSLYSFWYVVHSPDSFVRVTALLQPRYSSQPPADSPE